MQRKPVLLQGTQTVPLHLRVAQRKPALSINLHFFGEDGPTAPTMPPGEKGVEGVDSAPAAEPPDGKPAKPESMDYQALYETDRTFQGFVDKQITKATQTAVQNALQKQQRLNDERLSESEKLKEMSAEERARYWENKANEAAKATQRYKEVESLKSQTVAMLTESGIPDLFLEFFDFNSATADDIQGRVKMLGGYEYHPKGAMKKAIEEGVAAGVKEKLKQAAPETRANGGAAPPKPIPTIF